MTEQRFGEPIEVPWWVLPVGVPPAGVMLAALVVPSPAWARITALVSSAVVLWLTVRVSVRVASRNLQSVWVSTIFGLWVFFLLMWVAGIINVRASG